MRALHPDASVVLAATGAVLALVALSFLMAPASMPARDAPLHQGQRVSLEARVLAATASSRGMHLVVADETARLPVVAQPGLTLPRPGDRVRLVAVVTQLAEGVGLSAESLVVTQPAASQPMDPAQVARQPHLYEGARLLLRGTVTSGAIVGGGARILLTGETAPAGGGTWLAAGTLFYDVAHAAYEIKVDAWSRPS